jgi:hypothetical protein
MASPVLVNGVTGVLATPIFVRGEDVNIIGYHIYNPSNATAFVQFFDTLLAPTVGTTVPMWSIGIPTLVHAFMSFQPAGLYFGIGLWVAATTTVGGSGAPSAAVNVNLAMS